MEIKQFDAVIYDMDGVLIDSEPLWKKAIIKVFGTVGIDLTIEDCARTVGLRLDEVVAFRFRERPWTGKSQQEIIDEIMAEMVHQISTFGKPITGVLDSLEYFKNQG
ncbi:HAD hydrolase-like protein, partial [Lishizhenia sp.]|uniref:HAD hydrolase-like protein n=1 Tax=Lishizhenia sp. TaxID=2497594 RepID=UPI00299F3DCF